MNELYEEIIQSYLKENPITSHYLGIHEHDGLLPNLSLSSIEERVKTCREQLEKLSSIPKSEDKKQRFSHELIVNALESEIFNLSIRKEYLDNPAVYIFPLAMIETSYTSRNFASVEDRTKSITNIQSSVPRFLQQALENLNDELPQAKIIMSVRFAQGISNYWQDKLIEFVSQCSDEELINKWSKANLEAIEALNDFILKLNEEYLPRSHSRFELGKDKFLTLLKCQEGVTMSVEKLLEVGQKDLDRNYNALIELGKKQGNLEEFLNELTLDQPQPNELINEVTLGLDRILQFLVKSEFVDIPTQKQCEVIHTPEFARAFASGAMSTPGPFESGEASEAYYWVTPPDPSLSNEKIIEYMRFFSYPMLEILTIHEVWPGHYLQLLFNNQSDNKIAKIYARSTSMIEGWAHYTEEAVIEFGYTADGKIDLPKLHAAQLLKALMRNVRYISAIKMHCFGMSIEESVKLFEEKAFMSPIKSKLEANRGTIDPMYLNYTLGKLMIKKLKSDYKLEVEAKGHKFTEKEFHNKMLSFGSPPITVLRNLLLDNPGTTSDVL